jgi:hypothetical protein
MGLLFFGGLKLQKAAVYPAKIKVAVSMIKMISGIIVLEF